MNKKGLSPVIATVLILVLTFVAISVVAVFVIPFVNNSLTGSQDCFGTLGAVTFEETPYNCYANGPINGGSAGDRTGFSVRVEGEDVVGLRIGLFSGGSSEIVRILDNTTSNDLSVSTRMLDGNFGENLIVPSQGGVRTYVADGNFNKFEVSAILKSGKTCDVSDSIEIGNCIDNDARSSLLEN